MKLYNLSVEKPEPGVLSFLSLLSIMKSKQLNINGMSLRNHSNSKKASVNQAGNDIIASYAALWKIRSFYSGYFLLQINSHIINLREYIIMK